MAMTRILTRLASAMAFAALVAGCATEQVRVEAPRETIAVSEPWAALSRASSSTRSISANEKPVNSTSNFRSTRPCSSMARIS